MVELRSREQGGIRVGVDVGGTFTDLLALDEENGQVYALKTNSTPEEPDRAIVDGLRKIQSRFEIDLARVSYFSHGTTLAVNTPRRATSLAELRSPAALCNMQWQRGKCSKV